jgi:hypothetical protein
VEPKKKNRGKNDETQIEISERYRRPRSLEDRRAEK